MKILSNCVAFLENINFTFHLTNKDKKVEIQIEALAYRLKLSNRKGIRVENYSKPASKKRNPGT